MQTNTLFTLIIAGLVLALIGLAIYSRRTAESARADGYDEGYDDAKHGHDDRITALHEDIERLHRKHTNLIAEHRLERDAIILDCDARIAIYAARALKPDDILTLRIVNNQLLVAVQTYTNLKLLDQARFANSAAQRFGQMIDRIADALPKEPDHVEGTLNMVSKQEAAA